MKVDNILGEPGDVAMGAEVFELLAGGGESEGGGGVRVERILSRGATTAKGEFYDQEDSEWVMVVQGDAVLEWEDGSTTAMGVGDWVLIEAHKKHRVASTSVEPVCVWVAVHGV